MNPPDHSCDSSLSLINFKYFLYLASFYNISSEKPLTSEKICSVVCSTRDKGLSVKYDTKLILDCYSWWALLSFKTKYLENIKKSSDLHFSWLCDITAPPNRHIPREPLSLRVWMHLHPWKSKKRLCFFVPLLDPPSSFLYTSDSHTDAPNSHVHTHAHTPNSSPQDSDDQCSGSALLLPKPQVSSNKPPLKLPPVTCSSGQDEHIHQKSCFLCILSETALKGEMGIQRCQPQYLSHQFTNRAW